MDGTGANQHRQFGDIIRGRPTTRRPNRTPQQRNQERLQVRNTIINLIQQGRVQEAINNNAIRAMLNAGYDEGSLHQKTTMDFYKNQNVILRNQRRRLRYDLRDYGNLQNYYDFDNEGQPDIADMADTENISDFEEEDPSFEDI